MGKLSVVGLAALTVWGCSSEENLLPKASLKGPSAVVVGARAEFDASGSTDIDGQVVSWVFDFGDGKATSADATAVVNHVYELAGNYLVKVTVTDDAGGAATAAQQIEVVSQAQQAAADGLPLANFAGPASIGVGDSASFDGSASTTQDETIATYEWDYNYDGANFDVDDNGIAVSTAFTQAGQYVVALRITVTYADSSTSTDLATQAVTVLANQAPVAAISASSFGDVGQVLNFDGTGSFDLDGTITTYEWDFDYSGTFGADANGPSVNYAYPAAGAFTVALQVTDDDSATGLITHDVQIEQQHLLTITELTPTSGPRTGGTEVTLTGTGFVTPAQLNTVTFGTQTGIVTSVPDSTTLNVLAPAHNPTMVKVTVTNSNGLFQSPVDFTYDGSTNAADHAWCWLDTATLGTELIGSGVDDLNVALALPFDFSLYGKLYLAGTDELRVTSNGWMSFSETAALFMPAAIPSGNNPDDLIAPLFFDQHTGSTGGVYYYVDGSAPNRRLIVQWNDMTDVATLTDKYIYQAVLYEGSHDIKFQFFNPADNTPAPWDPEAMGQSAVIGLQDTSTKGDEISAFSVVPTLSPGGGVYALRYRNGSYDLDESGVLNVYGTSVPEGATVASNFGTISLYLSQPIKTTTATASPVPAVTDTLQLEDVASSDLVAITPDFAVLTPNKDAIQLTVDGRLGGNRSYQLTLATDANPANPRIEDLQGNPLSQDPLGLDTCPSTNAPTDYVTTFKALYSEVESIPLNNSLIPYGIGVDQFGTQMYVGQSGASNYVKVLDIATWTVDTTVDIGSDTGLRGIAASLYYVVTANADNNSVTTLEPPSLTVNHIPLPGSDRPISVAIDCTGSMAFLGNENINALSAVEFGGPTSCDLNGSDPDHEYHLSLGNAPVSAVASGPTYDSGRYYVANSSYFFVMDFGPDCTNPSASPEKGNYDLGYGATPLDIVINSDSSVAYVVDQGVSGGVLGGVVVLDISVPESPSLVTTIDTLGKLPNAAALSADGSVLAVTMTLTDEIGFFDTATNSEIQTLSLGGCGPVDIATINTGSGPALPEFWVLCQAHNTVRVIR